MKDVHVSLFMIINLNNLECFFPNVSASSVPLPLVQCCILDGSTPSIFYLAILPLLYFTLPSPLVSLVSSDHISIS